MTTTLVLQWIFVFVMMTLGDFCWAKYTKSVAKHKRMVAAAWSAAIVACGSVVVMSYTENHFLLTAAIAGAFCGTYLALGKEDEETDQPSNSTSQEAG